MFTPAPLLIPGTFNIRTTVQQTADAAQANWYLSATGISTASGADVGHPIPPAELSRRLNGLTLTVVGLMTVHYDAAGDPTGRLLINWNVPVGCQTLILGTPTSTGVTGTLTTWIAVDRSAGTPASYGFTDSALPAANSWTAHVGSIFVSAPHRIRITSGARSGLCMSVLKDMNTNTVPIPKTARVNPPYYKAIAYPTVAYNSALTIPVAGDPYVVESLPNIGWVQITGLIQDNGSEPRIIFKDVALAETAAFTGATPTALNNGVAFFDCHVPWIEGNLSSPIAIDGGTSEYITLMGGSLTLRGTGVLYYHLFRAGTKVFQTDTIYANAEMDVDPGADVRFISPGTQFFDSAAKAMILVGSAQVQASSLSGSVPALGAVMSNGATLLWDALPTLNATTAVLQLDGVNTTAWGNGIFYDKTTGTNVHQTNVSTQPNADTLVNWSADASLTNNAAQYIPRSGAAMQLAQNAGLIIASARIVSRILVAHQGNAANVAQTITYKIQKSTDHGATFSDLTGASSGAIATTDGAKHAEVDFTPILVAEGTLLLAIGTPSAGLGAVLTGVSVGLR